MKMNNGRLAFFNLVKAMREATAAKHGLKVVEADE